MKRDNDRQTAIILYIVGIVPVIWLALLIAPSISGGSVSYTHLDVPLGDDAHGNIVRIDNGIERFEETLADTKNSLENTEKQFETAKQEIEKPFAKEEELRAKTARLDELNILLNMDKKENEIVGGEPDEGEAVGGRKEKSYER